MADDANAGEDFGRETFELAKDLDRMTEQMENISVNLTWMAYDMVVLRTDPQLSKSIKRLENEFVQCKAVICGSGGKLVDQSTVANHKTPLE
ncbi:synaptonemal complex central element protein 3 isoform X1 [Tachysurus fulvidraco]|nr:synaptonemal complex central element protein 3 isoform X1 [Tachysurus fulvidraco]